MAEKPKKQPTVFILYIPGGAMLGILPALTLSRIEALTETPTNELFQVIEGVSTGAILAAGLNLEDMTARQGTELFVQMGPMFFPDIPGRMGKMHARNGINIAKVFYDLDPQRTEILLINRLQQLADKMRMKGDPVLRPQIDDLEEHCTRRWMTVKEQKSMFAVCQALADADPNIKRQAEAFAEILSKRTARGRLSIFFKRAAVRTLDNLKEKWMKIDECLFDASIPQEYYQHLLGDRTFADTKCSTYISAYDVVNNRVVTFSSLKKDLFDTRPEAPATVKNDIKLWDAVMASTANPFAFAPHITENNLLCSDKAMIHKPRSIKDVMAAVKPGTRVVLVVAGTGKQLSNDIMRFLKTGNNDDGLSEQQRYRMQLEALREYYKEFGVAGNLAMGRETAELEGYINSDAMDEFREKLGPENIFEFSPRLAPHTPEEKAEFPSKDVLDASRENIQKIIRRGRQMVEEEDAQIRKLSQMLIDNMHMLGRMDDVKHARLSAKIGIRTRDTAAEVQRDTAGIEAHIASNDNSTGLTRVWRQLRKKISNGIWGDPDPTMPPGPPPPGP